MKLTVLRDFQLVTLTQTVFVPWDDEELRVSFATFRDRIRPGQRETWTVKVEGPKGARLENAAAELLAYMYDRSLDVFVPYQPRERLWRCIRTGPASPGAAPRSARTTFST